MKKLLFPFLILFCTYFTAQAQYTTLNAHSHNDYQQKIPFFEAYNAHFGSIEADIWEVNGELFVAHDKNQITPKKTLDSLYIQPIVMKFKANGGKAWNDRSGTFQLLIDLKSPYETTLNLLIEKLKKYPEVFDPAMNKSAVKVVISGNRPNPEQFVNYPEFIFFDGVLTSKYNKQQLKRVGLFSDNLASHTPWIGVQQIPENDLLKLKQVIESVHKQNLEIRFWNAPDMPQAWQTLQSLKVDFINTDHIQQLKEYLSAKQIQKN